MKKYLFIFAISLVVSNALASSDQGGSLGNFITLNKKEAQFTFRTDRGIARVWVYSPTMMRITIGNKAFKAFDPYAVVAKPQKTNIRFENAESEFVIKTDSLMLRISKFPLRFTFETPDGQVINSDDRLGTFWDSEKVYAFKHLFPDEKFIGLGEKTGSLNRRGSAYIHWNTDNPHYRNWDDPLYSSIPFYIGLHNGLQYGIFLDNTTKTHFNFGAGNNRFSFFSAEGSQLDYYFIYHRNVEDIVKEYAGLTGKMPLPPRWGLGFQQCRWSYTPDKEVMEVATTFRDKKIPLDVLYLDIAYMDHYKVFTWNPKTFSNPKQLIGKLKTMGIHTMVIIDPGIKVEKGYQVYDEGVKNNYFIKYPDGSDYTGQVWPGWCHFPDFTKPAVRTWWGKQFSEMVNMGITGFWNDMNEIATWGKEVPPIVRLNVEGNETSYARFKNVYGMEMARATYEGTKKLMKGRRPLILTRSGFAGLQRYSAIWTGDNQATDNHMLLGIRLVNSFGLSGVPFAGYDVGGFGGDATPALYARWISLGTFSPFFRVHSAIGTRRSEPWSYGENTEKIAKHFIRLRYNLLPYIYSVFYEATQTGMPVQRSLALHYAHDSRTFYAAYENQYLLGPSFLIAPSKSTQKAVKVFLPKGDWYSFFSGKKYQGNSEVLVGCPLNEPAVFVKGGAIIPIQKQMQNSAENSGDTLEIHLYKGSSDNTFIYYEDNGTNYDYQKGVFYKRSVSYYPKENKIIFYPPEGSYITKFKMVRLQLHGFDELVNKVKVNGKKVAVIPEKRSYLAPYQKMEEKIQTVNFSISNKKIVLIW